MSIIYLFKMRVTESLLFITVYFSTNCESAKILCLFLIPIRSHNLIFRPLTEELLKRGHEIVAVTVDPIFPKGEAPENMTEIDIQDLSYKLWFHEIEKNNKHEKNTNMYSKLIQTYTLTEKLFKAQCKSDQIQNFVNNESNQFDLIIIDSAGPPSVTFSYIFKVPVIPICSALLTASYYNILGITRHTQYYVNFYQQTIKKDLSLWQKFIGLYEHFSLLLFLESNQKIFDDTFKKSLAPTSPPLSELNNNIHMFLVNLDTIWDSNLPISSNVFNWGYNLQHKPFESLPTDLQKYLDSSKNGVIYISFGTNVLSSALPTKVISAFISAISQLPYDVLWKWDKDEIPDKPENVKIFKWLPQADVLRHPKIKLFVTQAGQHSTDEAIHAGVPLIGIPQIFDQLANAEKYVHHGIGKKLDMKTITPEIFKDAIETVIGNKSYHRSVINLRNLLEDKPMTSMEKSIWAIEYVLRHGGAHHMRSPASNLSWTEYFELELWSIVVTIFIILICCLIKLLFVLRKKISYSFSCKYISVDHDIFKL